MKRVALLCCAVLAGGCAQTPKIESTSPAAVAGHDLAVAAIQATQDFAQIKSGNINYAWAVSEGLNAYSTIVKTSADVKALVKAWTNGKGLKLADRLAALFADSTGTPAQKTAALASGVQTAAASK